MLMQATSQGHVQLQERHLELRILAGVHQGACVKLSAPSVNGVSLSNEADADVWISDAPFFEAGNAWLYTSAQYWCLQPEPLDNLEAESWLGNELEKKGSIEVGQAIWLGDVCLVVCEALEPWQDASMWARTDSLNPMEDAFLNGGDLLHIPRSTVEADALNEIGSDVMVERPHDQRSFDLLDDGVEMRVHQGKAETRLRHVPVARNWRTWATFVACAIFMGLVAGLVWWVRAIEWPESISHSSSPISEDVLQHQQQEARMVIALVDPSLRLQIDSRPHGGVRISGWLADQKKLDQVVQALASLRPLPQIALRTVADLNDIVKEVGRNHGLNLSLRPQPQNGVQVSGLLREEDKRQEIFNAVKASMPEGMQLEDGLYAPSEHVPVVTQWLSGLGVDVREVAWIKETLQLNVRLGSGQRRTLEQALLRRGHPLEGLPFRLLTVDTTALGASPAKGYLPANSAGAPVELRTIVGGLHPYVVTLDGQKLQPGAQVGTWKLVEVAKDHVLWEGPQRLKVSR